MIKKEIKETIRHELGEQIIENYDREVEELDVFNLKGTMKVVDKEIINGEDITTLNAIKKQIKGTKVAVNELMESLSTQPDLRNRVAINIETELDMLSGDIEYQISNYKEEEIKIYGIEGTATVNCQYEENGDYMLDEFRVYFDGEVTEEEGLHQTYEAVIGDYKKI